LFQAQRIACYQQRFIGSSNVHTMCVEQCCDFINHLLHHGGQIQRSAIKRKVTALKP
jgi:hypothetical protein